MDLFNIRLRLGASRTHYMSGNAIVLNFIIRNHISNDKSGSDPAPPEVTIESRSTILKSFDLYHKLDNIKCPQSSSRPFYSCLLRDLTFEWQRRRK